MSVSNHHAVKGKVLEALPNAMWAVELKDGTKILARVSGSLETRGIRVIPGDHVDIEISTYDLTRGRIVRLDP